MRVIECNHCGQALSAANDDELQQVVRRHMDQQHADAAPDDAQLADFVRDGAYEATDS